MTPFPQSPARSAPPSLPSFHFSGIAGAGMNPLAQLMRAWGHDVQGSDRSFDQGVCADLAQRLRGQGIVLHAQDGSAVRTGIDRFIYSAAVEQDTPELRAARARGIPLTARPGLLAEVVNAAAPGVAIAGTSGKSTVTGMVAWILRRAGMPATILGGAALAGEGVAGCFAVGERGGPVIAEACESDGTLIGYRAGIGLIHNISRDHGELAALRGQFAAFARQATRLLVNAACAEARALAADHPRAATYGTGGPADHPLEIVSEGPDRAAGVLGLGDAGELVFTIPQPGAHNVENAAAAALICRDLGVPVATIGAALGDFPGVARRFQVVGVTDSGIRVVDDYAHNGEKIRAAIRAAQAGCERLVAVFQPHGFGPARFLRPELADILPRALRPRDRFCYAGIYYAGGTVAKDISSRDLAGDIGCAHADDHAAVLAWTAEAAGPGDTVLVMGARDPALPALARAIHDLL